MDLDILVFAAHPDDAELGCGGTIAKHILAGKKVGIVDLTEGELSSRGSVKTRYEESKKASEVLNISVRENLKLADGFFDISKKSREAIIIAIRKYRPKIILCNAPTDRHPDHGRASKLVSESNFYSGLVKIKSVDEGLEQIPWRSKLILHYIQDRYLEPDIIIDISETFDLKMKAIKAFKSQFYDPESKENETPISSKQFLDVMEGRCSQLGRYINKKYGEGFICERILGVENLDHLL